MYPDHAILRSLCIIYRYVSLASRGGVHTQLHIHIAMVWHVEPTFLHAERESLISSHSSSDESSIMAVEITGANSKASGELVVGPLFEGMKHDSMRSSVEKGIDKGQPTPAWDELSGSGHDDDPPPTYHATFEGDQAFYVPIERYEGKHRYDPDFRWKPQEEKKLVRKVGNCLSPQQIFDRC